MGRFESLVHESLVSESPDRKANILRVTRVNDREVHIQFRNLRWTLLDGEIDEWRDGFTEALKNLGDYFRNDIG